MVSRRRSSRIEYNTVVLVVGGPLTGHIVYSDDDGWETREQLESIGLDWNGEPEIEWEEEVIDGDDMNEETYIAEAGCRISYCYRLYPFYKHGTHVVPHAWLRVPTFGELFKRSREVYNDLADLDPESSHMDAIEYSELMYEASLIEDEIRYREMISDLPSMATASVFLCHASEDKGYVRRVYNDLRNNGQLPWMDEAEITAGQSIVDAVDNALGRADVFIFFMSEVSVEKPWVKKEWNSALMRRLADSNLLFIPALIDDVSVPPILSDLRHVRFFENYYIAFEELHRAVQTHKIKLS